MLECQIPGLKRLLRSLSGVSDVVAAGESPPPFDCQLPLVSLPLLFATTHATIPSAVPYLWPEQAEVQAWQQRLGPERGCRIGLVWHGRQNQILNRKRSCPLSLLEPLLQVPGAVFYSLQLDEGAAQLAASPELNIIDLTAQLADFADTQPWAYAIPPEFADTEPLAYSPEAQER